MDTTSSFFYRWWRTAVVALSLGALSYLLYFHRLGNLLPGYSSVELRSLQSASDWHTILHNPLNVAYTVPLWLLTAVLHHGLLMTRVVAACYGVLAAGLFYAIVRPWHTYRAAFLGTIVFATSAGFLHSSRLGSAQVLQMGVLAFIGASLWYRQQTAHRTLLGYAMLVLLAGLLYIPGLVWFELLGVAIMYRGVGRQFRRLSNLHRVGWTVVALVIVSPLVLACVHTPHIIAAIFGLPNRVSDWSHVPSGLLNAVMSVAVRSDANPLYWVGHTPLLSAAELIFGLIGGYYYIYRQRSNRTIYLVGASLLGLLLAGLGGGVSIAVVLPLAYLFVTSGIEQFLGQWLAVFPRNPLARAAGVGVVCIVLFFSVLYQVRSYFVAWPHTLATRQAFNHRQP